MSKKWFSFMVANGLSFVVAIVILQAASKTITALTSDVNLMTMHGDTGAGLSAFAAALIGTLATYFFTLNLMLKADNMAAGMTGGASVGESLFGKLMAGAAAAGMAAVGAGAAVAAAKSPGAAVSAVGKTGEAIGALTSSYGKGIVKGGSPRGYSVQGVGILENSLGTGEVYRECNLRLVLFR